MKTKIILATLLLATSAFGAGFARFGVGVRPGFGYRGGFYGRGYYGGFSVAAPLPVVPYYAPSVPAFGYGYVGAPYPAYGVGFGYSAGFVRPTYPRPFYGGRVYGGRVYGGRAFGGYVRR